MTFCFQIKQKVFNVKNILCYLTYNVWHISELNAWLCTQIQSLTFTLLYYINITFPDWGLVENIMPRNVIINRGAAEVYNHISRDDIFDYHPVRECNIYFIIPNIRSFIFYRLRPTMVREVPKGK